MRNLATMAALCFALTYGAFSLSGCASGGGSGPGGVAGNEGGSEPVNEAEGRDYKKAIVRCYKTGGTKVVKIMGELRCY